MSVAKKTANGTVMDKGLDTAVAHNEARRVSRTTPLDIARGRTTKAEMSVGGIEASGGAEKRGISVVFEYDRLAMLPDGA